MSSVTPDRRTVIRTAAWAVPAVTLATTAPAFATTPPACMTAANPVTWQTFSLTIYSRVRTLVTSPITNRTDGVSRVVYSFTVPQFVRAGSTVAAQPLSYTSTLSTADTSSAYSAGGRTVQSGYVNVGFNYGAGLSATSSSVRMDLNPGNVTMPSSGQLTTTFTGTMPALTAQAPGTYQLAFAVPPEPVESNAATWNGEQKVKSNIFGIVATARVHSMTPTVIPADKPNDWGTAGQSQSLIIANYTVVPSC